MSWIWSGFHNNWWKSLISGIKEYTDMETNDELDGLAIQSGIYSRYKVDPNIAAEHFEKLYKLWILKSVNRTLGGKRFRLHGWRENCRNGYGWNEKRTW